MENWLQVLGRLHPLILHLPIGLLVGLAIFEFASVFRPSRPRSPTLAPLAWLCAAFAVFTAVSGYVLADRDGYATDAVTPHLILGIFTAIGAVGTAFTYSLSSRLAAPRAALLITLCLLIPTGHLGASLTHGDDFLTGPLARAINNEPPEPRVAAAPRRTPPATSPGTTDATHTRAADPADAGSPQTAGHTSAQSIADNAALANAGLPAQAPDFATVIQPFFNNRCISCHGGGSQKGGLSLASADDILYGGDSGPAIIPSDPAHSELLIRLRLPRDIRGHMPPRAKAQPSPEEIDLVEAWITAGAPFGAPSLAQSPSAVPASDQPAPVHIADTAPAAASSSLDVLPSARPQGQPDAAAVNALRERLVHVAPVAADDPLLSVSFAAAAPTTDDATAARLLKPLAPWIADLNLSRSGIGRESIAAARDMPALRTLNLRATPITAADLEALRGHAALATLILAQSKLSDDALASIESLPALRRVYLWNAGVSDAAIADLRARKPGLMIDAGDTTTTEAIEKEGTIALSSEAPPPGADAGTAGTAGTLAAVAAALKPINTTCPVSGAPIDPKYSVLYEGRVIGFCCPNCPKEFWTDPDKFLAKLPK